MAHYFPGTDDPAAIVPLVPVAGKGVFTVPQLTDDGDNRDAGAAEAGVEANRDSLNWLVWRIINIVDGATTAFTTAIQISNPWTTLGRFVHSGVAAWTAHRAGVHIAGADATFTFTDGDTFIVDPFTHGATRTYTLAPPGSNVPALYRFRIRQAIQTANYTDVGTLQFKLAGASAGVYVFTYAGVFSYGKKGWCMELEYDASTGLIGVCGLEALTANVTVNAAITVAYP